MMTLPKPVREMIGEVVTATQAAILTQLQAVDSHIQRIHYLCCPPDEMLETLIEWNRPQSNQYKKYPLIGLLEDITVNEGRADAYYGTTSLNLIICTATQATYKSHERETKTFAPILRPIFEEFKVQLDRSPYFANARQDFPMDVAERKRWGRDGLWDKDGNLFADRIDAIELTNLELTLRAAPVAVPFRNF